MGNVPTLFNTCSSYQKQLGSYTNTPGQKKSYQNTSGLHWMSFTSCIKILMAHLCLLMVHMSFGSGQKLLRSRGLWSCSFQVAEQLDTISKHGWIKIENSEFLSVTFKVYRWVSEVIFRKYSMASKVAQQVKTLASKPDDRSLIPEIHLEEENKFSPVCKCTHTHK